MCGVATGLNNACYSNVENGMVNVNCELGKFSLKEDALGS